VSGVTLLVLESRPLSLTLSFRSLVGWNYSFHFLVLISVHIARATFCVSPTILATLLICRQALTYFGLVLI
jgi:hypothetical protein